MSHSLYASAIFGLGILLFLAWIEPALAIETYQTGPVLLSDDFNDGDFNGWTVESGVWLINSGKRLTGIDGGYVLNGKISRGNDWDNYRIELDLENDSGIDTRVGFRRKDSQNSYEVDFRFAVNGVIGFQGAPQIVLSKNQSGATTQLFSTTSVKLIPNTLYHVKLEVVGEHLQMWVGSTLVFDLDDKDTQVKTGALYFSYNTSAYFLTNAQFDNIIVTQLNVPKPIYPVIFIPGMGGSELKVSQDTSWSKDNGHGGIFTHNYSKDEKVWVNQDEAVKVGDDDYFDILKLKSDGVTPEASLSLTGNLSPFGYSDIDSFFGGLGYVKGINYFVFNYDWRKDIRNTQADLDSLIETAKQKSGLSKVNIVAHSMGGLVARYYISDNTKATKVSKLIELGVPHLGSPLMLKTLVYGFALNKNIFGFIPIGIIASEIRDISQNAPTTFQLLPSTQYYNFYDSSSQNNPLPFKDDRDIDNNKETGVLSFTQLKTLLTNQRYNMTAFNFGEQLHNFTDPLLNQLNNIPTYEIIGSSQPTLGQINETWWVSWPVKLLPRREEIYINGDDTVPLYSASLKSDSKDLTGGAKLYYVEQRHEDLPRGSGTAMQTVKAILADDTLPTEVKDQKITLDGQQISVDQNANIDLYDSSNNHTGLNSSGDIETNIPNTFFDSLEDSKNIFIKKSAGNITVKVTSLLIQKANLKIRNYSSDSVIKTSLYRDIPLSPGVPVQFIADPTSQTAPTLTLNSSLLTPTSEASGSAALDQTPPKTTTNISGTKDTSGNYNAPATITLDVSDSSGSGVLKTEYSLDNGITVQTYTKPLTISIPGTTTVQIKSTDKMGNEEIPQTITITINQPVIDLAKSNTVSNPVSTTTTSSDTNSAGSSSNDNPITSQNSSVTSLLAENAVVNFIRNVLGLSTSQSESEKAVSKQSDSSTSNSPIPQSSSPIQQLSSLVKYTSFAVGILTTALVLTFIGPSVTSGVLNFLTKFF